MEDPVLFLDMDGVLNRHIKLENQYCGTDSHCVSCLNEILDSVPNLKLVISSAWRYMILRGDMTVRGFEQLLLTHGVKCEGRVIGCTEADLSLDQEPSHYGANQTWRTLTIDLRGAQIQKWVNENRVQSYVVLDDLPIDSPNLYRIDPDEGLSRKTSDKVISQLQGADKEN